MKPIFFALIFYITGAWSLQAQMIIQGNLGSITDGKIAKDGTYNFRFELYDDSKDGSLVWSEVQEKVLVVNGLFNVVLGSREPLDSALLEKTLFLQIHHLSGRTELNPSAGIRDSSIINVEPTALVASVAPKEQVTGWRSSPYYADSVTEHVTTQGHNSNKLQVSLGGYIETYYQWNFNNPANKITALRGFDNRHNTLTISNFVLGVDASYKGFYARLALNIGLAPSTFYEQEPVSLGSYNVPTMDRHTWQFIQEAKLGYRINVGTGLHIQAGIMATPIGIEGLPLYQSWDESAQSPHLLPQDYRENWNWSRSNCFMKVPDYHMGIRVLYSLNSKVHFGAYFLNGANSVIDNNKGKTMAFTTLWTPTSNLSMGALYMSGPERDDDAPEGAGWRHLWDTWVRWNVTPHFSLMTQFVPGMESTRFGMNWWIINVVYARVKFNNGVMIAARYEHLFENMAPGSSNIFLSKMDADNRANLWEVTATLSVPIVKNHLMLRMEYRYDSSRFKFFYKGQPELDPSPDAKEPYIPNATSQNTLTLGLVGWF